MISQVNERSLPHPHAFNYPSFELNVFIQVYLYFSIVSTRTILLQKQYFELTVSDLWHNLNTPGTNAGHCAQLRINTCANITLTWH